MLGPDLVLPRAPARASAHTHDDQRARDPSGRFAKGHSGNPQGRPRGIPNPERRAIGLRAWRENREAALTVAERRPWLLHPLLRAALPPRARPLDPAERIGANPEAVQTPAQAERVLSAVWEALRRAEIRRAEIGSGEAGRIARRLRAQLRLQRRYNRIVQRQATE